jgi:hypothetical protein
MHSSHSCRAGWRTSVTESMCGHVSFVIGDLQVSETISRADWPELALSDWIETRDALHLWLQIVGKVRLRLAAPINHYWHSTFYLTARGLTTSPMPYHGRSFNVDFDLVNHRLVIATSDGSRGGFTLQAGSVAEFYERFMSELKRLGLVVHIYEKPNELPFRSPRTRRHGRTTPALSIVSGARFRRPIAC